MKTWNSQPRWFDSGSKYWPRRMQVNLTNRGNGNPDRPSKQKRREFRLLEGIATR